MRLENKMEDTVLEFLVNNVRVGSLDENSQTTFKTISHKTFSTAVII